MHIINGCFCMACYMYVYIYLSCIHSSILPNAITPRSIMINSPPADPATTCKPAYVIIIDQSIQDGNLYKYTIDTDIYNITH